MHCAGVTPTVKCDVTLAQGRANHARLLESQRETTCGFAPRERSKFTISENRLRSSDLVVSTPLLDLAVSLTPQGYLAQFAALSDRKSTRLNSSHLGISYAV